MNKCPWFKFCTVLLPILVTICISFPDILYAQTKNILWSEDWERDNWSDDWHADQGTWDAGVPTSGPGSAYAGQNCAATVLGGDYVEYVTSRLIRHTYFTVPPAEENPRLRFWHWFSFNNGDYGKIQIKVAEDAEWTDISENYNNIAAVADAMTFTSSGVWTYPSIDLSPYSGKKVQIAFYFYSTQLYSGPSVSSGWYIDNVAVITGDEIFNNPEDWESGLGDWYVDKGTWEIGIPASGPDSSYARQNCAATVLGGNYAEYVDSRLISPLFVVPSAEENPRLRFRHWFNFNNGDYGEVQIKSVNSNVWSVLPDGHYDLTSAGLWTYPYMDISAYADSLVQICFYFYSIQLYSGPHVSTGWYIDDVTVLPLKTNYVKITSPNGGELLPPGSSHEITWSYGEVETVTLRYSINNGTTWTEIAAGIDASSKSYVWTVPDVESSQCLISISSTENVTILDVSDSIFSIKTPEIRAFFDQVTVRSGDRITVPVNIDMSDSSLLLGEYSATLTWPSSQLKFVEATGGTATGWGDPLLNPDDAEQGELKCSAMYADGSPGNVQILNLTFDVVGDAGENGTIQLALSSLSTAKTFIDLLPFTEITDFTYIISAQPAVTVTAPNGGEVVHADSPYTITWSSTIVGNVMIQYTTNGGNTWINITGSTNAATGEYEWTVPAGEVPDCIIRISSTEDSGISDESDASFSISPVGIWGDVNGSGAVNSADGLIIASYGIDIPVGQYEGSVLSRGDVNADGKPDLADGLICARYGIQPDYDGLPARVGQPIDTVEKAAVFPAVILNEMAVPTLTVESNGGNTVNVNTSVSTRNSDIPLGAASIAIRWNPAVYLFAGINKNSECVVINEESVDSGEIRISMINCDGSMFLSYPVIMLTPKYGDMTVPVSAEVIEAVHAETFAKLNVSHDRIYSGDSSRGSNPGAFGLEQNVPNPFNPVTTIRYTMTEPAFVTLQIYNIQGQLVKTLVSSEESEGFHSVTWNGTDERGLNVSSGIYMYQLITGKNKEQKQMLLVR